MENDKDMTISEAFKALSARFDKQDEKLEDIQKGMKKDWEELDKRLSRIELVPFDPTRTVCITGFPNNVAVADDVYLEELFNKEIGIGCNIRNVKRMGSGLLKCEVGSVEEKINILQAKMVVREKVPGSWIRSSKSNAERIMEENILVLLYIMPDGYKYKVASDGRIIIKSQYFENDNHG